VTEADLTNTASMASFGLGLIGFRVIIRRRPAR
jgi:hypothetical protein